MGTGYGHEGVALHLHVWLADRPPTHLPAAERRRWKDHDDAILKALAGITHAEVEAWLTRPNGPRGYDRSAPEWRHNRWHASPLVPYQMAVERIVAALGGRDGRGRLTPSTSRAIRHALRRLERQKVICLRDDYFSVTHRYLGVRYAPSDEFVWQGRHCSIRPESDDPARTRRPEHRV